VRGREGPDEREKRERKQREKVIHKEREIIEEKERESQGEEMEEADRLGAATRRPAVGPRGGGR